MRLEHEDGSLHSSLLIRQIEVNLQMAEKCYLQGDENGVKFWKEQARGLKQALHHPLVIGE